MAEDGWSPQPELQPEDFGFPKQDRYELRGLLGEGGMGRVYRVHDRQREMQVALKTLQVQGAGAIADLKREFRALAERAHPNVCALYELEVNDEYAFFTMEHIDGETLLEHLGATTDSAEHAERLLDCLVQLADALDYMHEVGLVHRDIKPSNLIVDGTGRLVVIDFGLVQTVGRARDALDAAQARPYAGTPRYMAPERQAGEPASPASDWYSVGVILDGAVRGGLWLSDAPTRLLEPTLAMDEQDEPTSPPPRMDAPLLELAERLMEPEPSARPDGKQIRAWLRERGLYQGSQDPARSIGQTRSAPFVGRDSIVAELEAVFTEEPSSGLTPALLISGAPGVGKTRLAEELLGRLGDQGYRVLRGRCYDLEHLRFNGLDSVVEGLGHVLALDPTFDAVEPSLRGPLLELFPTLAEVVEPSPSGASHDERARRRMGFRGLRQLFDAAAEQGPIVVFVDDLQWADRDSFDLLASLTEPSAPTPFAWLATHRPDEGAQGGDLAAFIGRSAARRLRLSPLSVEGTAALVRAMGGPIEHIDELHQQTAGNPLFVSELLSGPPGDDDVTLGTHIRARVQQLPAGHRHLLEHLAVSREPLPLRWAAQAAQLTTEEREQAFFALRRGRLLRPVHRGGKSAAGEPEVAVYHDRIREAVVDGLTAEQRAATHRALAQCLEAKQPSNPGMLARHYEGAGELEQAARYALEAGEDAFGRLAFHQAARFFERARTLGGGSESHTRGLRRREAEALSASGQSEQAARRFLDLQLGAGVEESAELRVLAAQCYLRGGHYQQGMALAERTLAEQGIRLPRTATGMAVATMRHEAAVRLRLRRRPQTLPARTGDAALLRAAQTTWDLSTAMTFAHPMRAAALTRRYQRLALRTGDPLHVGQAIMLRVFQHALNCPDGSRAAWRYLEQARALLAPLDQPELQGFLETSRGHLLYREGRLLEARQVLDESEQFLLRTAKPGWILTATMRYRMIMLVYLGELGELARTLTFYEDYLTDRDDRFMLILLDTFRIRAALFAGDLETARRRLAKLDRAELPRMPLLLGSLQHLRTLVAALEQRLSEREELDRRLHRLARQTGIMAYPLNLAEHRWLRSGLDLHWAMAMPTQDRARGKLLARVARDARALESSPVGMYWGAAPLRRAALHQLGSRPERAAAELREGIRRLEMVGHGVWWLRSARLLASDTDSERQRHAELLRCRGVAQPARASAILLPGVGMTSAVG